MSSQNAGDYHWNWNTTITTNTGYWPNYTQLPYYNGQPWYGGSLQDRPQGLTEEQVKALIEKLMQSNCSTEDTVVEGTKPIVLKRVSEGGQSEYATLDSAVRAASALCTKTDDEYVVYMPVKIVRPKSEVIIDDVPSQG